MKTYHAFDEDKETLTCRYDTERKILSCKLKPDMVFISPELLRDIRELQNSIVSHHHNSPRHTPKYLVWQNENDNIFNLGIDITYLLPFILKRDREAIEAYLYSCIDTFYLNAMSLDLPIITMSFINGKTYGAGFEFGLTSDIVVASEKTKCGFPEIKYSLFPSVGLIQCVKEFIASSELLEMLLLGKSCGSEMLIQHRLVNYYSESEDFEKKLHDIVDNIEKRFPIYVNTFHRFKVTYENINDIMYNFIEQWINHAFGLSYTQLDRLKRLVGKIEQIKSQFAQPQQESKNVA